MILVFRRKAAWVVAGAAALFVAGWAPPVDAHAGNADGSRPFVTGVEPALAGIGATAVFAGSWQISLSVTSPQDVTVLDDANRAFVRIVRDGVDGDYGAPAWYTSAIAPDASGAVRLPSGVGPASPPDWRPVSRARGWAWFDPRISAGSGAVSPDMVARAVPVRLRDFDIPLLVGDTPAHIKGYLEFEPPRGRYGHRLLSPPRPAPGVEIGLLAGQAVPTVTVRNDSPDPVTVLGADGEPFLRVGSTVEANLASPAWVQVGRALGRTPKAVADATAQPQWEAISEGHLLSWADFRSRPPDAEPPVSTGYAVEVRRWTIPLRIGAQPAEIKGATTFEPFRPPSRKSGVNGLAAAAAGLFGVALAVSAWAILRRRGSRSLR
ncbi:MAG: hypothetical protein QOD57_4918 [Actinomycetota bacterium]|nr:hypothetical protein [Actinomycetota bacterium]